MGGWPSTGSAPEKVELHPRKLNIPTTTPSSCSAKVGIDPSELYILRRLPAIAVAAAVSRIMNTQNSPPRTSTSTSSSSWFSGLVRPLSVTSAPATVDIPRPATGVADVAANRKNQLYGTLFKYGPKPAQFAFKTGEFNRQVIFIGGLTEGLFATEYMEPLAFCLENEKWSLVQLLLSSSYIGYGTSSLEQDASEIDQLVAHLINNENSEGVVLLGHSTGCQDIVHYLKTNFPCSKAVHGVILQAPVSDREHKATLPETPVMIDLAAKMINEGRGLELMPRKAEPDAPITAYRYHSLYAYLGDDDMFSSDLTEDQLKSRLGHMATTPCQVIFSMADENVPDHVDKKAHCVRLCRAMGGAGKVEIELGNHSLSNRVKEAVEAIIDFVRREGPKGWDDPWS